MNPKHPTNADSKALAAYFSELRRWAIALQRWEDDLGQREAELDRVLADGEEECSCTEEDAAEGCNCSTCEQIRQAQLLAVSSGDELEWLNQLYNLSDERKKK